ncbi:MAG: Fic family protein [Bacteriovoracaceae bacterium]
MKLFILFILAVWSQPGFVCDQYMQRFARDCIIQDKYRELRAEFNRLDVNIEDIVEYKAMRFIDRDSWDDAKDKGNFAPSQVYYPAPHVWNMWIEGVKLIDKLSFFDFDLKNIHKIVMDQSLISRLAASKGTRPGLLRSHQWPPGFTITCEDQKLTPYLFNLIFKKQYDLKSALNTPYVQIFSFRQCNQNYYEATLRYLRSSEVPYEFARWKSELKQAVLNYSFPPIKIIASYQRRLVAIHPFGDGNGRVSRFFQDIMSKFYDLPFVPAGDLTDDVLTFEDQYINNTYEAMESMLEFLSDCLNEYKADPNQVSRECRVISKLPSSNYFPARVWNFKGYD